MAGAQDVSEVSVSIAGRIVGIGASAGGLESLEHLFAALPADTGMTFVVVQHLSPDFRSLMDELIRRHSKMPVVIADDGMAVAPNHIYLMPPAKEMIIRDRHLVLTDKEPHTFSLPIDGFFRSLAQDVGPQSVAVVLSGSGSDGSRGIVEVHRAGGLVLAESATSAKFDGMPLSAAGTGVVDHIATPHDIARILCGLPPVETQPESAALSDDPELDAVFRQLRDGFGIDFSLYKTTTVGRRIQRRVDLLRVTNLAEYVTLLQSNADELNQLYQDLLIGVTQFFRDPDAFAILEREVIPQLLERVRPEEEVRVWVAGCATGEEAYSLAMLFFEQLEAAKRPMKLKILATDVHQKSLDYASTGIYGDQQLAHVSPARLARFFNRRSSGYQVSQELRQLIVFARHNLTKDAPFTKMHFISCRNMLIYLQPQAQRTVLSLFHFGLAPQGVLFLGASETPGALTDEFTTLDERWKLFRKRRDVQLLSHVQMPMLHGSGNRPATPLPSARTRVPDPLILATYDQLLDQFMPPGFLLDEERNLIDTFAGAERMLKLRGRRTSMNILDLLDDELRVVIAGAIQRAVKDRTTVSYSGVPVPNGEGVSRCTVSAQPMFHPRTGARNILITFREMPSSEQSTASITTAASAVDVPVSEASKERMHTLESELAYTRETLQATIEELETSNEEMQATNEELVASNEELQSTNEELHSVNEELYTVNAEYQQKIMELKELNADMAHLLEGTDMGTVFLDRELRIRRYTARIASVFRFQPGDVGRQIVDFSHNIERQQLMDEIEAVREQGSTVEDEVRDRSGTPYFLRILPYRIASRSGNGKIVDGPIEGVVLTLTDLTALDKARTKLEQLSAIVESSDDAIIGHDLDGTITSWNRGAERLYGYAASEAIGENIRMLMQPRAAYQFELHMEQLRGGERVDHVSSLCIPKDGPRLDTLATISPIYKNGTIAGASTIARDVSRLIETRRALEDEQKKVKALLAQAEEATRRREHFLAMLSHELRNPLAAVVNATTALNQAYSPEVGVRAKSVLERQAQHMKRLLDDLLDVSRITTNKLVVRGDDIDLREALETAIESTAPLFRDRRVKLESRLPDSFMRVKGDTGRLTQVFANLLANAANHSPEGSTVRIQVAIANDSATIRVSDEGVGIPPELQSKIFELFVQSDQDLARPRGGLGVGLSLAKSIVELHGGTIGVTSAGLGAGSEFIVGIPLRPVREMSIDQSVPGGPCRIVLVDDQDDSRDMLRVLFESRNHIVFDASDGPGALELIEQHKPDVAFIDIGLPVMNGFEVAQRIRKRPEFNNMVLVALTGYGGHGDIDAARAAGFDDHVTKPAEFKKLEQILARTKPVVDDA